MPGRTRALEKQPLFNLQGVALRLRGIEIHVYHRISMSTLQATTTRILYGNHKAVALRPRLPLYLMWHRVRRLDRHNIRADNRRVVDRVT